MRAITGTVWGVAMFAWLAACGSTAQNGPAQGGSPTGGAAGSSGGAGAAGSGAASGGSSWTSGSNAGGGTGGSAGDGNGAVTKYQACAAYINAQCNRVYLECSGFPASDDPCPEYLALCPDFLFSPDSPLEVEGVLACAEKWRNHPCEQLNQDIGPECGLPPGPRALGEACYSGTQCASRRCGAGKDELHPDCGACIPVGVAGDPCADGSHACPNGYECTAMGCQPSITFNLMDGAPCERYGQCYGDSLCFPAADGEMRCQPRRQLGEDCLNGAYCVKGATCGVNSKCESVIPAKLGELCYLRGCEAGGWCDNAAIARDTTRCIPVAQPGAPCQTLQGLSGDTQGNCPEGLSCTCVGEACAPTCVQQRHDGEACTDPLSQCIAGTECRAGKCVGVELQGLERAACE